jgi:tetratricopeptide (TPR) repeat protein
MRTLWLAVALTLATSAGAEDDEARYRQLLSRDDALMEQLELQSRSASLVARASLRANLRRLEADYRFFLKQHPDNDKALVAFGGFLYDQRRQDQAIQCWERAIAVNPRCAKAYNNLATHYGHFGGAAKALRYHQKAFELDPSDPIFHFNWATTCIMFRKDAHEVYGWDTDEIFRRSQEEFRKARDLAPQDFNYAQSYAETFYQVTKPDWQAALAAWQFCLGQPLDEVGRERVYSHLARVCIRSHRYDEAHTWLGKINAGEILPLRRVLERRLAEDTRSNR